MGQWLTTTSRVILTAATGLGKSMFGIGLGMTIAAGRLAFEKLIVVEPQRGSYVAKIRLSDVRQWMLVRCALEVEVVATCARDLPDAEIERLDRNIAYQRTALEAGDVQGFHELDTVLHLQLVDALGWEEWAKSSIRSARIWSASGALCCPSQAA